MQLGSRRRRRGAERRERARRRTARNRRQRRRRSSALATLTSSALALPGLAGSASAEGAGRYTAEYAFSYYLEHDLPASKVTPGGEASRYEIAINQFRLEAPLGDRFAVGLDLVHESMSGASPWYVIPDANGQPVQVMSGATIQEERTDATLETSYEFDTGRSSLAAGISTENDYFAVSGRWQGEKDFNEKNTSLSTGAGFSIDEITPTQAPGVLRVSREKKQSYSAFLGAAQVLGESTQAQTSFQYQRGQGFLSDPYKQVLVAGAPIADARPDARNQFTWLSRLRHHVAALDGSLHADYEFYYDDWKIAAHTLEVAWHQRLWRVLEITPSFRYYSQSQAFFYAPYFSQDRGDGLHSSDYRLSPYGALSWRVRAETNFRLFEIDWRALFAWQRYLSSADYALGKVAVGNPGLVSYDLFSVGLKGAF